LPGQPNNKKSRSMFPWWVEIQMRIITITRTPELYI
jgi:hypothetical protein